MATRILDLIAGASAAKLGYDAYCRDSRGGRTAGRSGPGRRVRQELAQEEAWLRGRQGAAHAEQGHDAAAGNCYARPARASRQDGRREGGAARTSLVRPARAAHREGVVRVRGPACRSCASFRPRSSAATASASRARTAGARRRSSKLLLGELARVGHGDARYEARDRVFPPDATSSASA